jgi:superfamily I DNA/RNA helicase
MTLSAYVGSAGVGKTHSLLEALAKSVAAEPLAEGQRVLALTYMHGSRQRLESRLRPTPGLKGRYRCTTVDRFAWELCTRWRNLLWAKCGIELNENDFEGTCEAAGMLLETAQVRRWVARSYPKVIVDEAQDLTTPRLRMMSALEENVAMTMAADEFQCLQSDMIPNPAAEWIDKNCKPTVLVVQRRTSCQDLIDAAIEIRNGKSLTILSKVKEKESFAGIGRFKVAIAPGKKPFKFAAACVSSAIAWNGGKEIAIITPARGDFASSIVEQVRTERQGSKQTGPFEIKWEGSDESVVDETLAMLKLPDEGNTEVMLQALSVSSMHPAVGLCHASLSRHRSLTGCKAFDRGLVREYLTAAFSRHRRFGSRHGPRVKAMTVHQAKNREFEGVIILWPFTATGVAEHKRRLLYNAITRAQRWCTIVLQSRDFLSTPPFTS